MEPVSDDILMVNVVMLLKLGHSENPKVQTQYCSHVVESKLLSKRWNFLDSSQGIWNVFQFGFDDNIKQVSLYSMQSILFVIYLL